MTLGAELTLLDVPAQINLGAPFGARFHLKNTSTEAFIPGTHKLGSQQPQDNRTWGTPRIELPSVVGPGQEVEFVGPLVASVPGPQAFCWMAVKEHVGWFGNQTVPRAILVVAPPTPPRAARRDPNDLVSETIFDTGAVPADRQQHTQTWTNNSGKRMLITCLKIWAGVTKLATCDFPITLTRINDGSRAGVLRLDHYGDGPAGAGNEQMNFVPYFALEPGETIQIDWVQAPITPVGIVQNGAIEVTIWWRYAPPLA